MVLLWEDGEQVRRPTLQKLYQYPQGELKLGEIPKEGRKRKKGKQRTFVKERKSSQESGGKRRPSTILNVVEKPKGMI